MQAPPQPTPPTPSDRHQRHARLLWRALVFATLGTVVALAAGLMWRARSNASLSVDQVMAYAAFLMVAAAGPVVVAVLMRRLSIPLSDSATGRLTPLLSPVALGVVASLSVAAAGLLSYHVGSDFVIRSVDHRLQVVAALKASLVKTWLAEAGDDVRLSSESPALLNALRDWRASGSGDGVARQRLVDHLWRLSKTSHYVEISLRDAQSGALLLSTTGDEDSPQFRQLATQAAAASAPALEDFHSDPGREQGEALYLGFFVTVTPPEGGRVLLHVGIDPSHELFPLIEQWPGASESAEVLLLRKEGQAMVVLNDTRQRSHGQPIRQVPATSPRYYASALAAGRSGALRGDDDRDRPVLVHAVPVEGTSGVLTGTLGEGEAFAELNRIALLAASLVGALGLLVAWWWVENHRHLAAERQRQHERAQHVQRTEELSRRIVSVQEAERRRWSAELHDRVGANLAAVDLNLKAIGRSVAPHDTEGNELLDETRHLLADTIVSIREFCSSLRPAILDYAGLVPAIEANTAQLARRTGMKARFDHAGFSGRCSGELESALFRIVQEALLNCMKHAKASTVLVTLEGTPDHLRLAIEDDGIGFDPSRLGQPGSSGGQGLLNLRERASFSGGMFGVDSQPGRGTRVSVELK